VILCGHRGCGKSRLGRALAEHLSLPFIDTDVLIEQRTGLARGTLFRRSESLFRAQERLVIEELPAHPAVIATGGGAVLDPRNLRRLEQLGTLIFLERPHTQVSDYIPRLVLYRRLAHASLPWRATPSAPISASPPGENPMVQQLVSLLTAAQLDCR
jgi:shikimate kinase